MGYVFRARPDEYAKNASPYRSCASFVVQVKFVESHAAVPDATATFVRFAIAAGAMLPFADWAEKEVLFAGEPHNSTIEVRATAVDLFMWGSCNGPPVLVKIVRTAHACAQLVSLRTPVCRARYGDCCSIH